MPSPSATRRHSSHVRVNLPHIRLSLGRQRFAHYLFGVFVIAQRDEFRMAQMTGRGPLGELDRRYQARFQPPALAHIVGTQAFAPPTLPALREILEWTT